MVVVGAQQRKCQSLEEHYQRKATKYWNDFYRRHNKFFKDRRYLEKDWGNFFSDDSFSPNGKVLFKDPELLNKYVGESGLAVRTLFSRARTCSPCILFFDEVDALSTKRGKEGGWVVERLLNQLLIELDGADQRHGVFVIGATNRPDVMDRVVSRPGRFGKLLYVPLPTADERGLILKALARKKPIDASVDLCAVAQMKACESLSGADLSALMNEAAMAAWEEKLTATKSCPLTIKMTHFERALSKITPSVSNQQRQRYQNLSESLKAA